MSLRTATCISGVNSLAYDEAIMAWQGQIQQEIAMRNPLALEQPERTVLYKEYDENDNINRRLRTSTKSTILVHLQDQAQWELLLSSFRVLPSGGTAR